MTPWMTYAGVTLIALGACWLAGRYMDPVLPDSLEELEGDE